LTASVKIQRNLVNINVEDMDKRLMIYHVLLKQLGYEMRI